MAHPAAAVLPNGANISKSALADYLAQRTATFFDAVADVVGQNIGTAKLIYVDAKQSLYRYDSTDMSSANDNDTVLVTSDARRYKKLQLLNWEGPWNSATTYQARDAVSSGGSSYVCKAGHTNTEPAVALNWATYWDVLAERGTDGTTFTFRDAWSATTSYAVDDVVTYATGAGTGSYICTAGNTGNAPTDTGLWRLLASPGAAGSVLVWRGDWGSLTAYVVDDVVRQNGSSYVAVQGSTGESPAADTAGTFWALFAAKGADGAGAVTSVFGRATNVIAQAGDYTTSLVSRTDGANGVAGTTAEAAIATLKALADGKSASSHTHAASAVSASDAVTPYGASQVQSLIDAIKSRLASPNMLINASFTVNQRVFAGGALAAGVFGHDRWRAAAGGASYTVAAGAVTLASGAIEQPVRAGEWFAAGASPWASKTITISVATLSGGTLTASAGGVSGTITAGAGVRSVTLTIPAGYTSQDINVALAGTSSVFTGPKMEFGAFATHDALRPVAVDVLLCQRYYAKSYSQGVAPGASSTPGRIAIRPGVTMTGPATTPIRWPVTMHTTPTVSTYASGGGAAGFVTRAGTSETGYITGNAPTGAEIGSSSSAASVDVTFHWVANAELP